jgi:hypothetical protein
MSKYGIAAFCVCVCVRAGGGEGTGFKTLPETGYTNYGVTENLTVSYIVIYATVTQFNVEGSPA